MPRYVIDIESLHFTVDHRLRKRDMIVLANILGFGRGIQRKSKDEILNIFGERGIYELSISDLRIPITHDVPRKSNSRKSFNNNVTSSKFEKFLRLGFNV